GAQPARVVYKEWPVFSPEHMCRAIFEAGRHHPVQQFEEEQRGRACGFTLHGDEGEGKRKKPIMIMMLNVISKPDPQLGGWSVRYLAGKGDQKYKVEWLLEKCFAGRRDRPWLDFFGLPFNQPE
ncbi:unnamed protein product, partial [Effrenium voratum]